ncbi:MAG TPA: MBL fold metallo-hydrolase [Thermoanaerobaculia bacterium]|nr:MBL fold metallo-hydrolase [Thermoanaerobaculia bacterium]
MDKDAFSLQTDHFTLEGRSRAGHETWFRIRELGVALDIGRCPDVLIHMPHVFITHAHLDHAAGISFYAGQRQLLGLEGGMIYVPSEAAEDMRALLALQAKMTNAAFDVEVVGVAPDEVLRVGRTHLVRGHTATHRVAARAYELIEVRHHLKEEYVGREGHEIAALRRDGVAIEERVEVPLLFYTGDTDRGILEKNEALYRAEVLIIECSFVMDGHQTRAEKYRHIHIDDIADVAARFENRLIVLTHFSRRYSHEQIRDEVRRRVPHSLRDRIRLALPPAWQTL